MKQLIKLVWPKCRSDVANKMFASMSDFTNALYDSCGSENHFNHTLEVTVLITAVSDRVKH